MKAGTLVASMTIAGILGGIAGALLVQGASPAPSAAGPAAPAPEAPDRSDALSKEVADLRARLEEMQSSVAATSRDASKLRMELERERKAAAPARSRGEGLESPGPGSLPGDVLHPPALTLEGGAVPIRLGRLAAGSAALDARTKTMLDLLRKTEDERWTAIREALSLNDVQEAELKAALKERDTALRDLTKIEQHEVTGADGNTTMSMKVSHPDPEKAREVRTRYDDRVNASLNADQAKKWREDGYEAAAGGGGAMVITSVTSVEGADR